MDRVVFYMLILLYVAGQWSCGAPGQEKQNTFTTGEVYIVADESLEPFVSTGIYNFENLNQGSDIQPIYLPEALAFQAFLSDTVKVIVGGRKLNAAEEKYFERIKLVPRYTVLGKDAVALIIHKSNPDSLITLDQLERIMKGNINQWNQINNKTSLKDIALVFDHAGSGSISTLKSYFNIEELPSNTFALDNNKEVVGYVSKNKEAIGIMGNNWINNLTRLEIEEFNDKVQVVLLSAIDNPKLFVRPEQTYIGDSTYALVRTIYAINRESRVGLGSGFASFLATDRGQRIMLKSGLLPEWMPPREIIMHE
jgi:phosphate transport system substrate-binding protein